MILRHDIYVAPNGKEYIIKDGQLIGADGVTNYIWIRAGKPVTKQGSVQGQGPLQPPQAAPGQVTPDPYRPVDRGRSGQVGTAPYEALANLPQRLSANTSAPESELMKYYEKVVDEGTGTWFWQLNPQKVQAVPVGQQSVEYADLDEATVNQAEDWTPEMLRGLNAGQMADLLRQS